MFYKISLLLIVYICNATISTLSQDADNSLAISSEQTKHVFKELNRNSLKEITFKYDRTFGTNEDVVIGEMGSIAIDKYDRVYIGDTDQETIHVFEPNGEYATSIGRKGRGPCEFEYITSDTDILFHAEKTYVTVDHGAFENFAHVFSLNDWSCSETIRLIATNKKKFEELDGYYPSQFYPLLDGNLLVVYRLGFEKILEAKNYVYYLLQDKNGTILSDPILRLEGRIYAVYPVEGPFGYNAMHSFPFYSKSLFTITKNEQLLTADSKNFEIRLHSLKGNVIRNIKHPIKNKKLDIERLKDKYERTGYMSQLGEGVVSKMFEDEENVPKSWPALGEMFVDDKDRIWVSTIIDDEINEWWILELSGDVITKFTWPTKKPIESVNNGYLYTRETDEETSEDQVVRYRVVMEKSESK